jgi:phosphohistidine phosphatase SixA
MTMKRVLEVLLTGLFIVVSPAGASGLAEQLGSDQYLLLMRHARAPGFGDPPGYSLQRCESQRLLDDDGRAQASRAGDWLREQGVRDALVYSSPWCRCRETAEKLRLGKVNVEPALGSFFDQPDRAASQTGEIRQLVARTMPAKGGKALILVTHHVNIRDYTGRNIGSGDMVLARVDPDGRVVSVTVLPSP